MGEKSNGKTYEGQEWRFDDPTMKRTKGTQEVLKGLECILKKHAFTMLAISYFLYSKPKTLLDMEFVYVQCKW